MSSIAALAGIAVHYAFHYAFGTPLWTDRIAEWIMARTPSRYAVFMLLHMGGWAKPAAEAGGLAALGFAVWVGEIAVAGVRSKWSSTLSTVAALMSLSLLAWFTGYPSWLGSVAFIAPALAVTSWSRLANPSTAAWSRASAIHTMARRQFLARAAETGLPALMTAGVVGVALDSYVRQRMTNVCSIETLAVFPFDPDAAGRDFGRGLVRKEITPVREFYGMSKDVVDPVIDPVNWRLDITVERTLIRSLTFSDLLALRRELRYQTLRCISNTLASDLMGTAEWAGIHLSDLVDRRKLPAQVVEAAIIGADGHDDSLNIDYAFSKEVLLATGMNGKTLTITHGFPLRLLAPKYYGCRNVKWIREIRFVTKPYYGTWQRLGYTKEPVIQIASHVDHIRRDGDLIAFGGVSFAGERGIRAVRVRANYGPWQPARLEPALGPYTWSRWTAQLTCEEGGTVEVNAQDRCGVWQALTAGNPFPNGPSGPTIVTVAV
jgi:DMSO/TMAO reductase YedYZ molybdopterin-dependent catalytic subunit